MMRRDECLKVLARYRTDEIVVAVYKAAQEWLRMSPSDLNYTFTGAMDQGSSHALGLALGRSDKRVVVLDGDGSLLMNLGTLVTIAHAAPKNLVHCLCQHGTYETNGAVSIPARGKISFTGLAREAKYPKTYAFDKLDDWEEAVARILQEDGPIFVDLRIEPGASYPEDFRRLYDVEYRERFRLASAKSWHEARRGGGRTRRRRFADEMEKTRFPPHHLLSPRLWGLGVLARTYPSLCPNLRRADWPLAGPAHLRSTYW